MSKKDYELTARAINRAWGQIDIWEKPGAVVGDIVNNLADDLATTNPRFDRAKFLARCYRSAQ